MGIHTPEAATKSVAVPFVNILVVSLLVISLPALSSAQPLQQPPGTDDQAWDVVELIELASGRDVWSPTRTMQWLGEIQRFDSDVLELVDRDGVSRKVPSKFVVRVLPRWRTKEAAAAHQLFLEGEYKELVKEVPVALESNLVRWQQRILIAELVQGVEGLGKPQAAGAYFLTLAQSKPPPLLFAAMPLCWTAREPDQVLRAGAQEWLDDPGDEAAQLLGASWLLFTDQQAAAQQALVRLQGSTNESIAQFAVAQGWRTVPPPQTTKNLNRWFEFRDKLLPPLQLGPTEFLADRLQRVGQIELAIGEWSRIGSQHVQQPVRAAIALEGAAGQLKRLGRDEDAQRFETWMKVLPKK